MSAIDRTLSGKIMAVTDDSYKAIVIISIISRMILMGLMLFETLNGAYIPMSLWLMVWVWLLYADNALVRFCSNHIVVHTDENGYVIDEYRGGEFSPYQTTRYYKEEVEIRGLTNHKNDTVVIVKTPESTLYISK